MKIWLNTNYPKIHENHPCYKYHEDLLKKNNIPFSKCIPNEVESFEDFVIVPITFDQNSYGDIKFMFQDYVRWGNLGIEPNFIFTANNKVIKDYVLNSPEGEYIILNNNAKYDLIDYLKEQLIKKVPQFQKFYKLQQINNLKN